MWRQTAFPSNEYFEQSISDDDIEEVGYDNSDCIDKLHALYQSSKKTSSFSDYYQSEVQKSGDNLNEPIQHLPKEEQPNLDEPIQYLPKAEQLSDSADDSISDQNDTAASECSLAYQSATSKFGDKYSRSNNLQGSEISEWIQILEESSGLDSQSKKPFIPTILTGDKGKAKPKFSIHSSSNQEWPIRELTIKENSHPEDTPINEDFDFLEDINEEDDPVPYNLIQYEQKEGLHPSMADLLEGLQGKNYASSILNSNVLVHKASDREGKKRNLPNLGERTFENEEDPPEYIAGYTSGDEEEIYQKKLDLLPHQIEGHRQTMADLFQETFNASTDTWPALPAANSSQSNFHGRLLQVMQLEKERHAKFSRFSSALHSSCRKIDKSTAVTVQIMSRSLEGRLIVCRCFFHPALHDKQQLERIMEGEEKKEKMVIFNPKLCENVDLVVGNLIRIYPPWKEVLVKEENIILCNYYSSDVA